MRLFYKKGEVVPKWIARAANPRDQKDAVFATDVCVRMKTVTSLKESFSRIDVFNQIKTSPYKYIGSGFSLRHVHLTGRWCEYSIVLTDK